MNRKTEELDPELEALEAELRRDELPDPGDPFFDELEERVMLQVADRPVPRRPWWRRLGELGRWAWRPAPAAALAGAAAVLLVALWLVGDRGPETSLDAGAVAAAVKSTPAPVRADVVRRRPPAAAQWLASLPPTDELWALEDDKLPALLAVLGEESDDPEDDELGPGEPVNEHSLDRLNDAELRALERLLPDAQPKPPRQRPRPSMRRPG